MQGNPVGVSKNGETLRNSTVMNQNSGPGQVNRPTPTGLRPKPQSPGPAAPNGNKTTPGTASALPPGKRVGKCQILVHIVIISSPESN